jgi:hypothetical protein
MKTKWTASLLLTLAMVGSTTAALAASAPRASEWGKTVAAAKREGQLVMLAPAGTGYARRLHSRISAQVS